MREEIVRLTSRYIARTIDNLSPLSVAQQNEIKRQFRFFQDDILTRIQEVKNEKTGEKNGQEKR